MDITMRWLGVAGIEITVGGHSLLIDPFFSRPSLLDLLLFRPLAVKGDLVAESVARADGVLVTHSHYDHMMDVPEVLRRTGAVAFGSPNTSTLLQICGVPQARAQVVRAGEQFVVGPFRVEVFPGYHTRTPVDRWINGPVQAKRLAGRKSLRATDYRMDACFSYRITVGGTSILVGGPVDTGSRSIEAQVLFLYPYFSRAQLADLFARVQPMQIILIHWDDFTRPLQAPLLPTLATTRQGLPGRWPPVRRLDLDQFAATVAGLAPQAAFHIPALFADLPAIYFSSI